MRPASDLAALAGPWLITGSIVAVNYGIGQALASGRALPAAGPIAAVAMLAFTGSQAAPGGGDSSEGHGLSVAAVQPGYDTAAENRPVLRDWEPGSYHLAALDVIGDLGDLTREASRRGRSWSSGRRPRCSRTRARSPGSPPRCVVSRNRRRHLGRALLRRVEQVQRRACAGAGVGSCRFHAEGRERLARHAGRDLWCGRTRTWDRCSR